MALSKLEIGMRGTKSSISKQRKYYKRSRNKILRNTWKIRLDNAPTKIPSHGWMD